MQYWINTVSRDHVLTGAQEGFTQAGHGKKEQLKQLQQNDLIAFYSPKTRYNQGKKLQAFTAIGRITDAKPYQVEMTANFHPWRRRVDFFECNEAPIPPLIDQLHFIQNKQHWGYPFRQGLFKIEQNDFKVIAHAMDIHL